MLRDLAQTRFLTGQRDPRQRRPSRTYAAHQPGYHRHIGYFYKMMISDVFISLDNVQFVPREWQNRQVFFYSAQRRWLTVPVNRGREPIARKRIVAADALRSHWSLIRAIYAQTPYFGDFAPALADVYARPWDRLVDLCDELTAIATAALGITSTIIRASELIGETSLTKGELLATVIERARDLTNDPDGAMTYNACVAPMNGSHYLLQRRPNESRTEKAVMEARGIEVRSFPYVHPTYPQHQLKGSTPFQPELSVFDLLFNCGPGARAVLLEAGGESARLSRGDLRQQAGTDMGRARAAAGMTTSC